MKKFIAPLLLATAAVVLYFFLAKPFDDASPREAESRAQPAAAGSGAPAPVITTRKTDAASPHQVATGYTVRPLTPADLRRLEAFKAQPRDPDWAGKSEALFQQDFNKLHASLDPQLATVLDSLECRQTACLATLKVKGFSQFRSYLEDHVNFQGLPIADKLPFAMKCLPIPIASEVDGAIPTDLPDYAPMLLLDCHQPVWRPLPPRPDASQDRLLNPDRHHLLPDNVRQNLNEHVANAQQLYDEQTKAYEAEVKRRDPANFVRLEPEGVGQ